MHDIWCILCYSKQPVRVVFVHCVQVIYFMFKNSCLGVVNANLLICVSLVLLLLCFALHCLVVIVVVIALHSIHGVLPQLNANHSLSFSLSILFNATHEKMMCNQLPDCSISLTVAAYNVHSVKSKIEHKIFPTLVRSPPPPRICFDKANKSTFFTSQIFCCFVFYS